MSGTPNKRTVCIKLSQRNSKDCSDLLAAVRDNLNPHHIEVVVDPDDSARPIPDEQLESKISSRAGSALDRRAEVEEAKAVATGAWEEPKHCSLQEVPAVDVAAHVEERAGKLQRITARLRGFAQSGVYFVVRAWAAGVTDSLKEK